MDCGNVRTGRERQPQMLLGLRKLRLSGQDPAELVVGRRVARRDRKCPLGHASRLVIALERAQDVGKRGQRAGRTGIQCERLTQASFGLREVANLELAKGQVFPELGIIRVAASGPLKK